MQGAAWKYKRIGSCTGIVKAKTHDSGLWKNIVKIWHLLENLFFWSIGNGEATDVLNKCWIEVGPMLRHHLINK